MRTNLHWILKVWLRSKPREESNTRAARIGIKRRQRSKQKNKGSLWKSWQHLLMQERGSLVLPI
ncbi:hypothetical protein I7I48_01845 [Histoplasma ohiense]|nr:hypothetical protein I7I48_01845 [Histoplasma ohiense (nom. inval.)]